MLPIEIVAGFLGAAVLLSLAPGPDNLFVLSQSALYGARSGIVVTLGLCTGLIAHTAAVALGVAALVQSSATAFMVLKLAGAAYLVYLAWQAFRAGAADANGTAPQLSAWQLYRRGVLMNITNPKVSIFFLALLPQFADPQRGSMALQLMLLGGLFIIAALLVFGLIALAAAGLSSKMKQSPKAQLWLNRLSGVLFIGLAARLAWVDR